MRYLGTHRQRNGRIVARLGLKSEAALASPERGWGLQGCLVAASCLLEGLCEVFCRRIDAVRTGIGLWSFCSPGHTSLSCRS